MDATLRSIARLAAPIVLDGRYDSEAWARVEPLSFVTYEPAYRQAPSESTVVRVAHDDEYLYVAARLSESDPSLLRASSLYRDRWSGDDRFGVLIDPFDDNETGLWFWTTPEGVRGDALVSGDGSSTSSDWNTYWDVAVAHDPEGWFAEFRIPFSSLGFQRTGDRVTMGLIAHRDLMSRNERHVYPDIPPDFNWRRPSLAEDVVLDHVESSRPVYVSPFVLSGRRREAALSADGSRFGFERQTPFELGGDIRYPVRPNLTVDLTVNTDFAQVEVDDQQVNLTRFGLFFPEKRQFFLERSSIFLVPTGGADRIFHSRRIGLAGGQPVRILGGARLAGRVGDWDVGVLDLQTESTEASPSLNHGVLRLRRRAFNDYSTVGGIVTSRVGAGGRYNVVGGLDTQVRVAGDHYVAAQWAHSFDDADETLETGLRARGRTVGTLGSALFRASAWRAAQQGFRYSLSGRYVGPLYNPEAGFLLRSDISDLDYSFAYSKIFGEESSIRRIDPFQLWGNVVLRNDDRTVESALIEYDTDITWKNGWGLWQDFELRYDDLREPVSFPEDTSVPAGSYWYFRTEGGLNMPPGLLLRAGVSWGVQRFFDGSRWNVGVNPTWNASRHLTLSSQYALNVVRFDARDQGFDSHLVGLRVQTALDTHLSLSAFLQYSSVADFGSTNVRLRYNLREGRDLWLVYDEGLQFDRALLAPRPPLSSRRTLLIKYTHTLGG